MQILGGTVRISSLEALHCAGFPLSEVIEVEAGAPAVDQVLLRRAAVIPQEVKAIKNKLLVKGGLEVRVAYRSRGVREPVQVLHTMPISQIIEAPGVTENTANTLRLAVNSLDVTPKADGSGAARLLELNARVGADVRGYAPVELPVVRDAYSTQGGVALDTRRLETRQLLESFREPFVAKEAFDLPGGIQSVLLLGGELLPPETVVKNDALLVTGKAKFHVIYLDGEGQIASADKDLPYAFKKNLKRGDGTLSADVEVDLLGAQESVSGGALEIRAELAALGELFAAQAHNIVGAVTQSEEEPPRRSPLTIYFAGEGEPLWEIAKRYRTTMDAVRLENELSGDTVSAGQMLLIPSV